MRDSIIEEAVSKAEERILLILEKERQGIINEAVKKALLLLPETVGNLITDHVAMSKINADFYKAHPEFKDHKDSVASVLEKLDGENPFLNHKDLLGKAVPEIRERIKTMGSLNTDSVSPNPSRTYEPLSIPKVDKQHGEL
ncbi:MAG: hypothetical protein IMF11_05405 [Proteobacteria bacterium]|nr:hypothetical protein [Pseudomonadota bacterium]